MSFKWRLYYADGSTFSDTDGVLYKSPPLLVVAASQPGIAHGEHELINGDYFLHRIDLDRWHEAGERGLDTHLALFGHLIDCIRPGFWMPDRGEFLKIVDRLREEARDV